MDQLDKPVEAIKIDLPHPSCLVKYLKTELLHLAALPDFPARKDSILSQAAAKPIQFQAKAQHKFQLGNAIPEIDVTPNAQATIRPAAGPALAPPFAGRDPRKPRRNPASRVRSRPKSR